MQLFVHFDSAEFDPWRAVFDDTAEARRHAGLRLLQLWRPVDDDTPAAFALFDVTDRKRAEEWLKKIAALQDDGISAKTHHFLETA